MLDRKLYQAQCDGRPVWVFLSDQQRWIEQAEVLEVNSGLVTFRYETEDEGELQAWQETVRLESVGSLMSRLSSVPCSGGSEELPTAECCPEEEQVRNPEAGRSLQDGSSAEGS